MAATAPSARSKPGLAPAADRPTVVHAVVEGEPGFEAEDVEALSSVKMRNVQTLREIRQAAPYDALALYRGVDALPRTRHRLFEVEGLRILVLDRGANPDRFERAVASKPHLTTHRDRLDYHRAASGHAASSTAVRRAIAAGELIADMVPPAVAAYIEAHRLYRD